MQFLSIFLFCISGLIGTQDGSKNETENKYPTEIVVKENDKLSSLCRVDCSVTTTDQDGNSVTYNASAGGIFVSCERAIDKCKETLDNLMWPE